MYTTFAYPEFTYIRYGYVGHVTLCMAVVIFFMISLVPGLLGAFIPAARLPQVNLSQTDRPAQAVQATRACTGYL